MLSSKRRIITVSAVAVCCLCLLWILFRFSPYPEWEEFRKRPYSPVLTDRYGTELRVVPLEGGLRRINTPLDEYPDYLIKIFLAGEDKRFYFHPGVDPLALIRAVRQNRSAGYIVSGASTVSMQLAGLAAPEPASVAAKLREIFGALRIESRHSKDELLKLWLSSLPFGSNVEGVAAAGRQFFGVQPPDISVEQALLLAVIPRRPELYSPVKNPEAAVSAAWELGRRAGVATSKEALQAAAENAGTNNSGWAFEAPHFVTWVESRLPPDAYRTGATVKTTLDLGINNILQGAISSRVEQAGRYRISNGSGLIIDVSGGEILAYVGSADFFDEEHSGQIDGVHILRQPGSTLKPFLYSMALESGFTAATILPDIPMTFGNEEVYIPQNYNQRYNGPVRLRTALSSSLNIPAVYLTEKLGVDNFAGLLVSLGFDSLDSQRGNLGVGLAIGNAEVSLFELVRAYTVFPRGGTTASVHWLSGQAVEADAKQYQVFEPSTMALIRNILSDNVDRVLAFGRQGLGVEGFDAMIKTGTSNQFNNIWAVGATPVFVCGIWMGNFSGETVIGSPGSGIPADAVVDVMTQLQNGERFGGMEGLHRVDICPLSGGAATDACPSSMPEWFRPGNEPAPCTWHSREGDEIKVTYPPEYRNWAQIYGIDFEGQEAEGSPEILNPADGSVFFLDSSLPPESQRIPVDIAGSGFARLYVNGRLAAEAQLPFRWFLRMERGYYQLRVETDSAKQELSVEVR